LLHHTHGALRRWLARSRPQEISAPHGRALLLRAGLERALEIYTRLGHKRGMGFVMHPLGMFALDSGAQGRRDAANRCAAQAREQARKVAARLLTTRREALC